MNYDDAGTRYKDGTYMETNPGWHDEDGAWKASQVLLMLERHGLQPQTVCDVGCGTGRVLDELSRHLSGTAFTGYDMAAEALEVGRARGNTRVDLRLADARSTQERYDLLLMMDVFEHVPDYLGFLSSFLDTSELFIFHIPLDMSVSAVLRAAPLQQGRDRLGHLHYFSRETALATLREAGYAVLDELYTPGGLGLPARTLQRKVAKLPRRLGSRVAPHLTARVLGGFSLLVLARRQPDHE